MLRWLLVLFIIIPIVEMAVLINVGRIIGPFPTIGLVLLTSVLGWYLAKQQGIAFLRSIRSDLEAGRVPAVGLIDGLLILVGAVLLLTPGFATDAFGFIFLFPPSRKFIKILLMNYIREGIRTGRIRIWLR